MFKLKKKKAYKRRMWCFKRANFPRYREILKNTDWNDVLGLQDIDDSTF